MSNIGLGSASAYETQNYGSGIRTSADLTQNFTVSSGNTIQAGTVLGAKTADGKLIPSLPGASDGSQTPIAVALHDIDAATADQTVALMVSGAISLSDLVYSGWTEANLITALRDKNIIVQKDYSRNGI